MSDASPRPEPGLPPVGQLLSELFVDLFAAFPEYAKAGLAPWVIGNVLWLARVGSVFAGAVLPYLAWHRDWVILAGSFLGIVVVWQGVGLVVEGSLSASTGRAVWLRLTTGERLTLKAPFSTMFQDLFRVLLLAVIEGVLFAVGLSLCVLPGLLVPLFLGFAMPAVVVHRVGVFEALRMSIRHTSHALVWDLGFFAVELLLMGVAWGVPVFGALLGPPVLWSWQLRGYRAVFGDGPAPRL